MALRVGINGLGRIGRAIFRINLDKCYFDVVAINDINPDNRNISYLVKYDSCYGKLDKNISADDERLHVDGSSSRIFHEKDIDAVPWDSEGVDIVIDSSGIHGNLEKARNLKGTSVRKCVVTNSPPENEIDKTVILGVNEEEINARSDFLISSSICDANAVAPVLKVLDREYGIDHGFLTTLHPWLNYQNLLDGPSISYSSPGDIYDDYTLGRASPGSLIPKTTSAISATCKTLKHLDGRFMSLSYRVPTMIVSSSDLSVKIRKTTDIDQVKGIFLAEEKKQKFKVFMNNTDPLVSADFQKTEYSSIVDHRWIMVNDGNYIKLILWYDNEWGYSSRVVDLVKYLEDRLG